jgi:hypothetical protein
MSGFSFNIGETVEWTSQSAGVTKTKRGQVVQLVQPRAWPPGIRNSGAPRGHLSYVVKVGSYLYWPRVKNLKEVSP